MREDGLPDRSAAQECTDLCPSVLHCPIALTAADAASEIETPRPHPDRLILIFELFLVLTIAVGTSVLQSVYPLFSDGSSEPSRSIYFALFRGLQVATSLAFLAYILFRKRIQPSSAQDARAAVPPHTSRLPIGVQRLLLLARQVRPYEWGLVCLVAFGQSAVAAVTGWVGWLDYMQGFSGRLAHHCEGWGSVLGHLTGLSVLALVLYRGGGGFSRIGLRWNSRDAAWGLPLFLLGDLLHSVAFPGAFWLGRTFGPSGWTPPDVGALIYGSAGLSLGEATDAFLNGFFEELIVRAFLMTGVLCLTNRTWIAVVISVSVQISYHFYQGVPLCLSHMLVFTAFALFYARTRCILPVALAHMLSNLSSAWAYELTSVLS